ncbi:MAG: peptidylprolyl isomerase [Sulfurimonas sp.]|nr:peptidylprolyl isomerase [Sulfurimonas sp.]
MKGIVSILICLSCLYAKPADLAATDVLTTVNGTKITKSELDRGVRALFPTRYYHGTLSNEQMKVFEDKVLAELVENELLFQYAKSIGIKVSNSDIDASIDKLKKLLETPEKLNESLSKSGLTLKSLKEVIYKEEMLKQLHKEKIETTLSEKDLKAYYDKNKHKFKEPQKIVAKIIYVRNDPTDPQGKSKAKNRIEEAYEKLKSGENFADVAAKYSTAMSRIKGGDLGYTHKGMLEPSVEEKAFSMDVNTTSEIIEEDIGFFIVRVEDKTAENQLSFDAVKKKLAVDLKKSMEEDKKSKLLENLKSKAVFVS